MKRSLVSIAILGLLTSAAQAQEVVKIGVAAPLTGSQAHLGKDIELLASAFPTLAARQGAGQAGGTCQSAFFAG